MEEELSRSEILDYLVKRGEISKEDIQKDETIELIETKFEEIKSSTEMPREDMISQITDFILCNVPITKKEVEKILESDGLDFERDIPNQNEDRFREELEENIEELNSNKNLTKKEKMKLSIDNALASQHQQADHRPKPLRRRVVLGAHALCHKKVGENEPINKRSLNPTAG